MKTNDAAKRRSRVEARPASGQGRTIVNFLDSRRSTNGDDMTIQVVLIQIVVVEKTTT
ncbi:MAG: hypothetical protein IH606_14945 [Burkholderiales bacterium]|nr:hypothetical protein [Burkholderiales bacterium]